MLGALGKLGVVGNGISLPRRVRNILSKYDSTLLIPGAWEPILGAELVVNGGFDTATRWGVVQPTSGSVAVSGGIASITSSDGSWASVYANPQIPIQNGKTYQIQWELLSATGSGLRVDMGGVTGVAKTTAGVKTTVVTVTNSSNALTIARGGVGGGTADNISVREILGYTNTYSTFVSGNYVESTGQTLSPVDGEVGLAVDAAGTAIEMTAPSTGSTSGWGSYLSTLSSDGTSLTITNTSSTGEGYAYFQQGNIIAGKTYRVEFEVVARSATSGFLQIGQTIVTVRGFGVKTVTAKATNTHGIWIGAGGAIAGNSATIRNVRLWELPGIHATQPTTQNKPVLRRGLVNLLTYSNDFGNAAWVKTNTTYSSGKLLETYSESSIPYTATQAAYQATANQAFTYAFIAKKAERSRIRLWLRGLNSGNRYQVGFNLNDGTILPESTVVGNFTSGVCSATNLGNDRYLCVASAITGAGETAVSGNIGLMNDVVSVSNVSYIGTPGYGAFIESAALFKGTVTAEQILAAGGIPVTTTAPASSAIGPQYWQLDGTDDRWSLSAVPFQMSDDHFVVAGCTRGATGTTRRIFHVGSGGDTQRVANLSIASTGVAEVSYRSDSGPFVAVAGTSVLPEAPVVLSATSIASAIKLRVDSLIAATGTNPGGATTLTAAAIGAHTAGSSYFNGAIHAVIFGKGAITDAELLTLEKFVAKLQGRAL